MKILFVLFLFPVFFTRLNGFPRRWRKNGQIPMAMDTTAMAIDVASMHMLKDIYKASDDKNVISSPLGVLTLLSLYSSGTNGTTRDEIVEYLRFPDYTSLIQSYPSLTHKFSSMDPNILTFANKVSLSNKYELTDEFRTVATRDYRSEVDTLNFTNPQAAAKSINQWVCFISAELKSRGNIKNPVAEDAFTPDAVAMLLNIIHFQGSWKYPFDTQYTNEREFHINKTRSVMKPTMHLSKPLLYLKDKYLRAKMIELPYNEAGFRMIVVLPDAVDGLPAVLNKLARWGILGHVHSMTQIFEEVELAMPKFEVKSKTKLKNILIKEGVREIFDQKAEGIVKGDGVKVSRVLQEAFVKVAEAGTTAGAFTSFEMVLRRYIPPTYFVADHPFLYVILHEDVVLFAGTYSH